MSLSSIVKFSTAVGFVLAGLSAPAFAANQMDMPVTEYLASCDINSGSGSDCEIVINVLEFYFDIHPELKFCFPPIPETDQEIHAQTRQQTMAVIGWLHDHPSPQNWDANRAVSAALWALYGCKK